LKREKTSPKEQGGRGVEELHYLQKKRLGAGKISGEWRGQVEKGGGVGSWKASSGGAQDFFRGKKNGDSRGEWGEFTDWNRGFKLNDNTARKKDRRGGTSGKGRKTGQMPAVKQFSANWKNSWIQGGLSKI